METNNEEEIHICDSWDCMMEQKINNIEKVLTRLTVIQEGQAKQIATFLSTIGSITAIESQVLQNQNDINKLGKKLDDVSFAIHKKEALMKQNIDDNRKELDAIGQGRLWKGVSTATALMAFAFGYLYVDMKKVSEQEDKVISNQVEIKNEIKHINRQLDKFEGAMNATRDHTH